MSDEMAAALMGFIVGFLFCALISFSLVEAGNNGTLTECAKQHNVYACEYVAVPKKEGAE